MVEKPKDETVSVGRLLHDETNQPIVLTPAEQAQFVDVLLDPPKLSDALKRARDAHSALIVSSE